MAPKKEQKAAAAAAAESSEKKDESKKNSELQQKKNDDDKEEEDEKPKMPSPILDKPTLVVLEDGRQLLGHLIAFDSQSNVILNNVLERRKNAATNVVAQRSSMSMCVPFAKVKEFYQRDTPAPEWEAYEKAVEAKTTEMREKMEAEAKSKRITA